MKVATAPTGLTYGKIKWQVIEFVADTADDPDELPDAIGVTGQVTIKANIKDVLLGQGTTPVVSIFPGPFTFDIVDGVMKDAEGRTEMSVIATDCAAVNPVGWNYNANFILNNRVRGSFDFEVPTGATIDLTTVAPVPGSSGTGIVKGDKGDPATVSVGSTTTLAPGTSATVTNSGDNTDAVLNFGIPKGDKGDTGTAGTITGATATGLAAGASPTVSLGGTSTARTFAFGIPKGDKGDTGTAGAAASVNVGTTTTGAPGSSASVTNSGNSSAAVLNFTVPQGAKGDQGNTGPANTLAIGTVTTGAPGSSAAATVTGTAPNQTLNLTLPQGQQGPAGSGAPDATTTTKGSVKLAGDLAGTADLPTVPNKADKSITISAGTGLSGGGDLSANRSLSVSYGTTAGTAVQGNDTRVTADQAAATASIRTLGTGATQAAAGNHSHSGLTADQAAGTASIRTLGTGATQAAAGNHTHTGMVTGSGGITKVQQITQASYDALGTKDSATLYVIVG